LLKVKPLEEAMSLAVGGAYDEIGPREVAILRYFGLKPNYHLVDVGCGSGRLAKPLSINHPGKYSGFDIVKEAVDYAREIVKRPDWRFEEIDDISIPEADSSVDMVCFFSVFTHLLHEQSYYYLEEAARVLKPGNKMIFSFLEFREPNHWPIFTTNLSGIRRQKIQKDAMNEAPINMFIAREEIEVWANHLRLKIEAFHDASDNPWRIGALGQAICVLSTPHQRTNLLTENIDGLLATHGRLAFWGLGNYFRLNVPTWLIDRPGIFLVDRSNRDFFGQKQGQSPDVLEKEKVGLIINSAAPTSEHYRTIIRDVAAEYPDASVMPLEGLWKPHLAAE
jgi:SAM-dependent methyltransferase